ncbi:solute carrier organic anion transporter [Pontibacter pudoricolor]|uniref:solute carrier organic anion transporter n=1 Tax=Pontibacter pudoricolor TaxID=2694930 RepID=UPI0013916262|nr:solute carrier organic anion transporter [Pontibacter pudoricolor]
MEIVSILAILIMAVGLTLTVIFLIGYLIRRRKVRLKNAAISFATVLLSLGLLIIEEELFFSYNFENKKEVLVASREAQIDGILLKLYEDSTFEIGGFREVQSAGNFELRSDTLYIIQSSGQNKYMSKKSFIMEKGYLREIEDTGIGFLEVHMNRLKDQDTLLKKQID